MTKHYSYLWLACLLGFLPIAGSAQFTVTGTITDIEGEALIGVSVVVQGTATGTVSDLDGNFQVLVPNDNGVLKISYIGYESASVPVTSALPQLEVIVLKPGNSILDEVVVTGLATTVKRSNLANSVEQISQKELTGVTSQPTLDGALYGKFRGADIRSSSGAPGGGMSVRLRGVTSIFGDQQPLFIVDGVYIDNRSVSLGTNIVTEAAGGGNTSNQDDASNRIADISPEDIESIEILKGASAAAIYGSRAAGGVVLITTKRGKNGASVVTFSQDLGVARPIRFLGRREFTPEEAEEIGGADAATRVRNGDLIDYEREVFDNTPLLSTSRLEVSGGSDKTNFFLGTSYRDEDGLVDNTGYRKASLRVNIGHRVSKKLDFQFSSNYINSTSNRGLFNNSNSNTTVGYALPFTYPWEDLRPDADGNYPAGGAGSNALETIAKVTNQEKVSRFIGGITGNWSLLQDTRNSLKLVARAGLDQYTLRTTSIFPSDLTYFSSPTSLSGVSISGTSVNSNYNLAGFLVYSHFTQNDLTFRTQIGLTEEKFDLNTVIATASGLNGSQTNVDQAANATLTQNRIPQKDRGVFIQEEINLQDKVFITFGGRADKSTNNGDANKLYFYPKAAVAINFHEFTDLSGSGISNLKLRAAYGQSGRFGNFPDRFNALTATAIDGQSGLIASGLRGNSSISPERQAEIEGGIEVGLLSNRINLDVTVYNKEITDLLLRAQVPASQGFTNQVVNGGALRNRGIEIGVSADAIRTQRFTWNSAINFWLNRSLVTSLSVPAFNTGGFAASLGQFRIQEGQPATQIVGTYATEDADGNDLSAAQIAALDPDGDGFRVYGNAEPDFNASWTNNFTFNAFELSILGHWRKGGDNINLSTLLYDLGGTTWDYNDKTLDPSGELGNGPYRTSTWFAGNAGPWIEDGGYFRIREIGLYYNLGREKLGGVANIRVGVSGRNLINFFDYNSYDPEVSNFGNNVLANNIEVTPYPSAKRYMFHLRASF